MNVAGSWFKMKWMNENESVSVSSFRSKSNICPLLLVLAKRIVSSWHQLTPPRSNFSLGGNTCKIWKHRLFSRNAAFPVWPPPRGYILSSLWNNMVLLALPPPFFRPCLILFPARSNQKVKNVFFLRFVNFSRTDSASRASATYGECE